MQAPDDGALPWVVELVTSWPFIYCLMFGPLVLMLANFVFGDCTITAMLEEGRGDSPKPRRGVLKGRIATLAVHVAIWWQYHVRHGARPLLFGHRCDVITAVVDSVLGYTYVMADDVLPLEDCSFAGVDGVYYASLVTLVASLLVATLTRPAATTHTAPQRSKLPIHDYHSCSKCAKAVVPGMDHHCYFIHNCVGDHNIAAFYLVMISWVGVTTSVLWLGTDWGIQRTLALDAVPSSGGIEFFWDSAARVYVGLGMILALMCAIASCCGLAWYAIVRIGCKHSTVSMLKAIDVRRRQKGCERKGFLRLLFNEVLLTFGR